jgi:hypothetical protein
MTWLEIVLTYFLVGFVIFFFAVQHKFGESWSKVRFELLATALWPLTVASGLIYGKRIKDEIQHAADQKAEMRK